MRFTDFTDPLYRLRCDYCGDTINDPEELSGQCCDEPMVLEVVSAVYRYTTPEGTEIDLEWAEA